MPNIPRIRFKSQKLLEKQKADGAVSNDQIEKGRVEIGSESGWGDWNWGFV